MHEILLTFLRSVLAFVLALASTRLLGRKAISQMTFIDFVVAISIGSVTSIIAISNMNSVYSSATGYKGLTKDIIIDGRVMSENLKATYLNEEWLIDRLSKNGVNNISDVFYAGLDTSGNLYVSKKGTDKETHGKYGIE